MTDKKYNILEEGEGILKDPDNVDMDMYPGGMRGFIDHVKATYGFVEPVKTPRMSSPEDEGSTPFHAEAAAPKAKKSKGKRKKGKKSKGKQEL